MNIGRYIIESEIGRGGMATVYRANDPSFRRHVAIKALPREFLHNPAFRARFEREAQTVASLEHLAIVPVYDFGEDNGQLYLVMRLMPGGSLEQRLRRGPLPLTEVARIFNRLAPALDYAHKKGVIHRDLKPANILFDDQDNPYLSDFGIAKLAESAATTLTASGGIVGTPAYMSPEQARAVDKLDGRTDIYAMGVILFQALTGELPYRADTPMGVAMMHIMDPIPQVRQDRDELPQETQSVIDKAMAKDPSARYTTADELASTVSNLATLVPEVATGSDSQTFETVVEAGPIDEPAVGEDMLKSGPIPATALDLPESEGAEATVLEDQEEAMTAGAVEPAAAVEGAPKRPAVVGSVRTEQDPLADVASKGVKAQSASEPKEAEPWWRQIPIWIWIVFGLGAILIIFALWLDGTPDEIRVAAEEPPPAEAEEVVEESPATEISITLEAPSDGVMPEQEEATATIELEDRLIYEVQAGDTLIKIAMEAGTTIEALMALNNLTSADVLTVGQVLKIPVGEETATAQTPLPTPALPVLAGTPVPLSDTPISLDTAEQVEALARWGRGTVRDVAYSSGQSGETLVVATDIGIYIFDAATNDELRFMPADSRVTAIDVSPDGELVVSAHADGEVRVWRAAEGTFLDTLRGHTRFATSVAFAPSGDMIASASYDESVRLWQAADNTRQDWMSEGTMNAGSSVLSVAFSPDGEQIASGNFNDTILVWNINGTLLHILEGHNNDVNTLDYSPDGRLLASGSRDDTIRLWNVSDGSELAELTGHDSNVNDVAFSPDGSLLASGSSDDTIKLWDVGQESLQETFSNNNYVLNLAFSEDGTRLANTTGVEAVSVWNLQKGRKNEGISDFSSNVGTVTIASTAGGVIVATGSSDGVIRFWDGVDGTLNNEINAYEKFLSSLDYSPAGAIFVSSGPPNQLNLWSPDGDLLDSLELDPGISSAAISPDGRMVAAGLANGLVHLISIEDFSLHNPIGESELEYLDVSSLAISAGSDFLVAAYDDGFIRFWRISDGELLKTLEAYEDIPGYGNSAGYITLSPDGQTLASCATHSFYEGPQLWDVESGELLSVLPDDRGCYTLTFSPDGRLLASGLRDGTIVLWDWSNNRNVIELSDHGSAVNEIAFAPDGSFMASASSDGTTRLWGVPGNYQSLNINTATTDDLQNLSGIGPTQAQAIVDYRSENGPFATIEEIMNVPGIGQALFESAKTLITVN